MAIVLGVVCLAVATSLPRTGLFCSVNDSIIGSGMYDGQAGQAVSPPFSAGATYGRDSTHRDCEGGQQSAMNASWVAILRRRIATCPPGSRKISSIRTLVGGTVGRKSVLFDKRQRRLLAGRQARSATNADSAGTTRVLQAITLVAALQRRAASDYPRLQPNTDCRRPATLGLQESAATARKQRPLPPVRTARRPLSQADVE